MKKFQVKFTTIDNKNIIKMYVKAENMITALSETTERFDVKEIRLLKEVDNDTLL